MSASQVSGTGRCNAVILRGLVHRAPETRELPSGELVLSFDIVTNGESDAREVVPVAWHRPPDTVDGSARSAPNVADIVAAGVEVVVTGRVRRRFFRVGGATQSRTEVIAVDVVPVRQRRRVVAAVQRALAVIPDEHR
jgi:single-strand DNA-binding protein